MLTSQSEFDRFVEPHEPGYFRAQAHGFALIREIDDCLSEAKSYAGRYTGYTDPVTHDLVITGECEEEYESAMNDARALARIIAKSNGYQILRAQGRSDELAQLVYMAHDQLRS
ncbi:hypothetical protein [Sphingobium cupriresistens]|uniref:Uncharacterized protein n=1 Tax=Sphingobium cupriresistens TaxID=1132417 RepID=A0A8G1ZG46_9SPHN|nr:hypothetical protein [Sphingobium cupriresistens]RYM10691.1 hypothetical protein EWH12_11095 [Sphingobium cupriresistens]